MLQYILPFLILSIPTSGHAMNCPKSMEPAGDPAGHTNSLDPRFAANIRNGRWARDHFEEPEFEIREVPSTSEDAQHNLGDFPFAAVPRIQEISLPRLSYRRFRAGVEVTLSDGNKITVFGPTALTAKSAVSQLANEIDGLQFTYAIPSQALAPKYSGRKPPIAGGDFEGALRDPYVWRVDQLDFRVFPYAGTVATGYHPTQGLHQSTYTTPDGSRVIYGIPSSHHLYSLEALRHTVDRSYEYFERRKSEIGIPNPIPRRPK